MAGVPYVGFTVVIFCPPVLGTNSLLMNSPVGCDQVRPLGAESWTSGAPVEYGLLCCEATKRDVMAREIPSTARRDGATGMREAPASRRVSAISRYSPLRELRGVCVSRRPRRAGSVLQPGATWKPRCELSRAQKVQVRPRDTPFLVADQPIQYRKHSFPLALNLNITNSSPVARVEVGPPPEQTAEITPAVPTPPSNSVILPPPPLAPNASTPPGTDRENGDARDTHQHGSHNGGRSSVCTSYLVLVRPHPLRGARIARPSIRPHTPKHQQRTPVPSHRKSHTAHPTHRISTNLTCSSPPILTLPIPTHPPHQRAQPTRPPAHNGATGQRGTHRPMPCPSSTTVPRRPAGCM